MQGRVAGRRRRRGCPVRLARKHLLQRGPGVCAFWSVASLLRLLLLKLGGGLQDLRQSLLQGLQGGQEEPA